MIDLSLYENDPQYIELKNKVIECGGDRIEVFGGSNYGGYLLQQNPNEFAGLAYYLQKQGPFNVYVEIGSASGGNIRFIYENIGFHEALSFDDNMHPHTIHQGSNSWHFGDKLTRYVGNSHHPEATQMLKRWLNGKIIDCVFIDGDHSLKGVLEDFKMLEPHFSARTLIIFHDTHSIPDIGQAVKQLQDQNKITPVAHFVEKTKTCGIMVAKYGK